MTSREKIKLIDFMSNSKNNCTKKEKKKNS